MLDKEHAMPHIIAYDKPSNMFLNFLRKHYGLSSYVPQTNNFVVFTNYFDISKGSNYTCMKRDPVPQLGMPAPKAPPAPRPQPKQEMPSYQQARAMAPTQTTV